MTSKALAPLLGGEYDRFLFASIGDEKNGMSLSVLSALARLGLDPWEETLALSRLPRTSAAARLSALIASTTRSLNAEVPSEAVAARLVALLPSTPAFVARAPEAATVLAAAKTRPFLIALGVVALVVAGYAFYVSQRASPNPGPPPATSTEATPR